MGLVDEIQLAIRELPVAQQAIVNTAVMGIHALCALADAMVPDLALGAVAVSVVGAEYQDKGDELDAAASEAGGAG